MSDRATLRDLRRTRQRRRLGEVEWFDVAYRVYLVALVGTIAVVIASDAVSGLLGDDVTLEQILTRGPATLGIVAVSAAFLGARGGAEGGPVSIESADVHHVLLAPIDRRTVMARPLGQRFRAVAFGAAVVGGVLGQLVARELDESRGGWAAAGALFGAAVGALAVGVATIVHATRLARSVVSVLGTLLVGWQVAAAWAAWDEPTSTLAHAGPASLLGSVALWGARVRSLDLIALGVVATIVLASFAVAGALRIEQLVRRGRLVSQLRFAATVHDLRTVVLVRRQLRAETARTVPWGHRLAPVRSAAGARTPPPLPVAAGRGADASAVWRRGMASILRIPAVRLVRIAVVAVAGGVSASLTVSASPLFGFALLAALFVVGLEVIEPLSQEIDRPGLTERLPVERGWLFSHHLVAPAGLLAATAVLGALGVALVEPGHLPTAAVLAVPVAAAGASGPIISAIRDAPSPVEARSTTLTGRPREVDSPFVPPEFVGFTTTVGVVVPLLSSGVGTLPVLAVRSDAGAGTLLRSVVGMALFVGAVVLWVRRRDDWSRRVRRFFAEGRAA